MTPTETVVAHHLRTLLGGDLEELLTDYAADSVIIHGGRVVRGRAAIRELYEAALRSRVFESLQVQHQIIEGEIAYVVWSLPPDHRLGSDTFLIRDGKIQIQTAYQHPAT